MKMEIKFEIEENQAAALSQMLKRIGFSEIRKLSTSEEETYEAQNALESVRKALADAGYNPR
mgnify:CR=1 FL=1|jgi:phosphoribosylformylglycinamidine (FGAM) synthase PurS component